MDIKQLEHFVEAVKTRSFTQAAATMYITQQGMSKSIKRLEQELGVVLFDRSASAIEPTKYAEAFLPYALEMLNSYKNSLAVIDDIRSQSKRELRIGVAPGVVNMLSAGILTAFITDNPAIDVVLNEYSDAVLDKAVENNMVDVGLCIMPVDEDKLTIHHIRQEPTCYMMSEQHPLAGESALSIYDLKNEVLIGFGTVNKGHSILEQRCAQFGFKPKLGIQTQDSHMIEDLCRRNMGVGFYVGPRDAEIPGVRIIPDAGGDWFYRVCVTTSKGRPLTNAMRKFINAMKEW